MKVSGPKPESLFYKNPEKNPERFSERQTLVPDKLSNVQIKNKFFWNKGSKSFQHEITSIKHDENNYEDRIQASYFKRFVDTSSSISHPIRNTHQNFLNIYGVYENYVTTKLAAKENETIVEINDTNDQVPNGQAVFSQNRIEFVSKTRMLGENSIQTSIHLHKNSAQQKHQPVFLYLSKCIETYQV